MRTLVTLFLLCTVTVFAQNYVGSQNCQTCHTGALRTFPGYTSFTATLHTKIHQIPSASNMLGRFTDTVSMGSAYGNAKAVFRISGSSYFVKLLPASGTPEEYQVAFTYGIGWKQRYLIKIGVSYYMMPVQWNLKKYQDNSDGRWTAYNPQNWFTSAGTFIPRDNAFRKKSWDKNCAGCHVVPGNKTGTVQTVVSGTDTAWVYNWANSNDPVNIVVGCESCHGYPASMAGPGHIKKLTDLSYDRKLEVCGQCHFRGFSNSNTYEYPYNESANSTYVVGEPLANSIIVKPGLWPDTKSSKQHHQQWLDMKLSKHYNATIGITCVTCHDPHQNTVNKFQLKEDFNSLSAGVGCVKCHASYAAVTNGKNNHSKHSQSISQCVNCHMTHNAASANIPAGYDISNHSFMPIRPNATRNYSTVTGGQINTCAVACHRNGSGTRGGGPTFSITDANLTNWAEATDVQLADTLWKYYQVMYNVTGITAEANSLPRTFALAQNFPNPFNPYTTIAFELPKNSTVRLEVFTMNGELVNVLLNNEFSAGTYKVSWDGKAVSGIQVPSGIYLYRLIADEKVIGTRKMVMLK